jgi:hypothetical protein
VHRIQLLIFFVQLSFAAYAQRIDFDCRACTLSDNEKWKIQKVAEYETAYFTQVFGPRNEQTIHMRIYEDEKKFRNAQLRSVWHIISETGTYNPFTKQILVLKWQRFLGTSYHEASHAVYHHFSNVRPTWIDEGMAEYFKNVSFDSLGNISIHQSPGRSQDMRRYVADSTFSILTTIKGSRRRFHSHENTYYYSVSWGIVYYLQTEHAEIFKSILRDVKKGNKSEKAIEREYAGGVMQLDKDLIAYYK